MARFPRDIFTEPDADPDTLANLGPLAAMAGIWEGKKGSDDHPVVTGTETESYLERYELQPIDPQTNGPQLFYGLRYHVHIVKPGEVETFHDQVGYWLWEPATGTVYQTLAIPRAQVALASGKSRPGARKFTVRSERGSTVNGICSNPFLEHCLPDALVVDHHLGEGTPAPSPTSRRRSSRSGGRRSPSATPTATRSAGSRLPRRTRPRAAETVGAYLRAARIHPGTRTARSRAKTAAKRSGRRRSAFTRQAKWTTASAAAR